MFKIAQARRGGFMTFPSDFWQGFRAGLPFLLVILPFGIVFGVVATEAGLNLSQTMGFSIFVIAGAAQFVAIQLMVENAPVLIVLATSLAVNLRMAMYSASLAPHLGPVPWWKRAVVAYFMVDQAYAASILKYEDSPQMTPRQKLAYYMGVITPVCPMWYVATYGGAVLGDVIPQSLPIDFAVPITFLALIVPMLRSFAHVVAALVSIIGVLVFSFVPFNLGLLLAALLAMVAGAEVERQISKRAAR
ncbi:MAG: branched chain amino acid exporter component AzlC [Roseibaca calidilacus]|uniref:Branched chain amino acid exporter component AzlC n=2 Tax=Roseibaca calidilacus TaxID=1666912 RepID=A0A0P7WNL1_9RHOB|nr:MAG: branched chain amino acid exporter component AzlC [Roseibaca calidilacus]CUX79726.1 Predicted branched-chain amino acid permease (azaleucine resistance) [Roseibaca calidilacus]